MQQENKHCHCFISLPDDSGD